MILLAGEDWDQEQDQEQEVLIARALCLRDDGRSDNLPEHGKISTWQRSQRAD
jgi:hypothetical protein